MTSANQHHRHLRLSLAHASFARRLAIAAVLVATCWLLLLSVLT